jgi:hypothetical protein
MLWMSFIIHDGWDDAYRVNGETLQDLQRPDTAHARPLQVQNQHVELKRLAMGARRPLQRTSAACIFPVPSSDSETRDQLAKGSFVTRPKATCHMQTF